MSLVDLAKRRPNEKKTGKRKKNTGAKKKNASKKKWRAGTSLPATVPEVNRRLWKAPSTTAADI
jgi:hypothetical protein